ncbi:MAG: type 1 glutamine amidotransferase domain-containing protein [Pseudomonadota bacterium]
METGLKIAIIATSNAVMGGSGEPTGVWMEEITTPYYAFVDRGATVDVFSIAGGEIPVDPRSLKAKGENEDSVERYLDDQRARDAFDETRPVTDVELGRYDAIFLPGGHGTMWDYPQNKTLAELVSGALESNKVVGAVCHGPAGLVSAKYEDGTSVVDGKRVAGFTDTEEDAAGFSKTVPFLLETRLRELGADYQSGPDFEAFAVRDGNLVTGQNPASAALTVSYVIKALEVARAAAE